MKSSEMKVHLTPEILELHRTIESIGIARFVGRINSGIIPSEEGYAALELFVSKAKSRPFLSRISNLVLGGTDTYAHH